MLPKLASKSILAKKFLKLVFSFLIAITIVLSNSKNAQAVDGEITYTGLNSNLVGDDVGAGPFNIGFTFNFYGSDFTQAYININGTLNFSENYSRYNNVPLSTAKSGTNISNNSIYAFWDDLNTNPSGGSGNKPIYYSTIGSSPNRKFVAQWTNIYFHGTTVQMGTFQIILYEGSNEIQIQYRDLLGNASQPNRELGNSATIGLRKDDSYRNQYSHETASITQGQAIRYAPNGANAYNVNTSATYDLIYLAPEGAPTSPTLVTPTDGTSGVTLSPSFEWLPVESATSYRILVSTVSNFSTTVIDQTTANTFYTYGSNLNTSTQYYWRVQATNSYGNSLSPTRSFTTAAVSNTTPNNPSSVTSTGLLGGSTMTTTSGKTISMTLSDSDESEQLRYRIQIATDSDFNSLLIDYRSGYSDEGSFLYTFGQSGGTYLVGSSSTTLPDDSYYVRLRAEDDSAASSSWYSSGEIAFTLEQNYAPNLPTSLGNDQMVNGSANSENQPSFVFTLSDTNVANTLSYQIEVDNDADFSSPAIRYQSGLAAQGTKTFTVGQNPGSGTYDIGAINQELGNGSYYWRVKSTDNIGDSSGFATANSGEIAFIVNNNVPGIDNLQTTNISSSSATISWVTDEATSSQIEYGLVSSYGFTTAITNTSPRVTTHEISLGSLEACARYFYRVKSANNASTQVVSERQTFTTSGCSVSSVTGGSEQSISLSGGEFEHTNNSSVVRMTVPASFANESAQFQINVLNKESTPTPPTNTRLVDGNLFNLVAITETGVILDTFDEPVTFSITYSEEMKSTYQASTIDVYKYDPETQTWEKKNCTNNTSTNTITCSLPGFSVYGIFGTPIETVENTNNSQTYSRESCNGATFLNPPELFQLNTLLNSVTLYFVPSSGGATNYIIEYGRSQEANEQAVSFSHPSTSGAIPYTINSLSLNETWFFKVKGTNGCIFSNWSDTKSIYVGTPKIVATNQVKELATSLEKDIEKDATKSSQISENNQPTYTVRIKVTHKNEPLKKVKIAIADSEREIETDENGFAIFEQIKGGLHRFKIIDQAYAAESEVNVNGDKPEFDVSINVVINKSALTTKNWLTIIAVMLIAFSMLLATTRRTKRKTAN